MNVLITVLIIVIVAAAAFWVVGKMGLTGTPALIARIVIGVLALIALANAVGLMSGGLALG
jgi:hypothetical protein